MDQYQDSDMSREIPKQQMQQDTFHESGYQEKQHQSGYESQMQEQVPEEQYADPRHCQEPVEYKNEHDQSREESHPQEG